MKIYCMSDMHGCLEEFEEALKMVTEHLVEENTILILLGDYIHGGSESRGVLNKVMSLQDKYGLDRVIALMGNHEKWVLEGYSSIDDLTISNNEKLYDNEAIDDKYIHWMSSLPNYHVEGNTIFVHAGIDEDAGDMWEWGTSEDEYTSKYPADTGRIQGIDMKVVAGHVGTAEISGDFHFHDIYYDGESHYYIDGTVLSSGVIPVLMVDTETDKYYRVTENGNWLILPYDEEN